MQKSYLSSLAWAKGTICGTFTDRVVLKNNFLSL